MGSSNRSIERALRLVPLLCLITHGAGAQPSAPITTRVVVGPPQRTIEVRIEGATLIAGTTRVPFPLGRPPRSAPAVESLSMGGKRLALLRYREGEAVVEVLLGADGVVHIGRADLHGDPGERTRHALTVVREGRDVAIHREDEDERVRLCDGSRLVRLRSLDVATGRFVARARDVAASGTPLDIRTNEGPERPVAPLVRFIGADFEPSPDAPEGTRDLSLATDARTNSFVVVTSPMARARPTLVGRWEGTARYPVVALGFVPRPTGASAPPPGWIALTVDAERFVLNVPADVAVGARLFARLPAPHPARCVVIEVGPPTTGDTMTLGDIAVFSSIDLEGGLERVANDIAAGGEAGTLAADVLARAGEPAARILAGRLEEMPAGERRIAMRVFARLAPTSETARGMLARALADEDETVRRMALEATRALGEAGIALLEAHVRGGGLPAAGELTRRAPSRALGALLGRLAAAPEAERPSLRPLMLEAARRAPEAELGAVFTRGLEGLAPLARAEVALVAAEVPTAHSVAVEIAATLLDAPDLGEDFALRHKVLLITRSLPPPSRTPALTAFARRAIDAEEWMLRAAAIAIVGAEATPEAHADRLRLLEDPYPRVRVAAIEAGPLDDTLVVAVARLARLDTWPIVRAAAVTAIAGDARTVPIQRASVRDRAERVRVAAIDVLTANRDVAGYEQVEARLLAEGERPEVYRAALRYVRALCVHQAVDAVAALLDRMAEDDRNVELAQDAALVLASLGTDDARSALSRAPGTVRGPLDAPNATRPPLCVPVEAP